MKLNKEEVEEKSDPCLMKTFLSPMLQDRYNNAWRGIPAAVLNCVPARSGLREREKMESRNRRVESDVFQGAV